MWAHASTSMNKHMQEQACVFYSTNVEIRENFRALIFSFYNVGLEGWILVIRLGIKYLYPLSHLVISNGISFFYFLFPLPFSFPSLPHSFPPSSFPYSLLTPSSCPNCLGNCFISQAGLEITDPLSASSQWKEFYNILLPVPVMSHFPNFMMSEIHQ